MENILQPHQVSLSNICSANNYTYVDENGKEYIDLESGIWCASLGHSHPKMLKAIEEQSKNFIHAGTRLKPDYINKVATKILDKAQISGKVFFMNTGSEAIEFAINLAQLKNKNAEIIGLEENYLGAYGQITSIKKKINVNNCLECINVKCSANCEVIKNKITRNCILIFDPFCFERQILEIPDKLIQYIKQELIKKNGILIIDEITSGLGRTGKWFGFQHYNLNPDLVVIGKTLGNGYPVSAVLMNDKIGRMAEMKRFTYAQSHQNDPLGCKIAESVIEILEEEKLIDQSAIKGALLLETLNNELLSLKNVTKIRGKGLMLAIVLNKEISVENIHNRLINKGIIIGFSTKYNLLNLFPAYTIPEFLIYNVVLKIKETIIEETSEIEELLKINCQFLYYKY